MFVSEGVMETGLVKWFNNAKGWGFIAAPDASSAFRHNTHITGPGYRTLRDRQHVSYDLRTGPRGQFAANVQGGVDQAATG